MQDLTDELLGLGATVVTTEEGLKARLREAGLPPPALALNCVGGSSATAVAKSLGCERLSIAWIQPHTDFSTVPNVENGSLLMPLYSAPAASCCGKRIYVVEIDPILRSHA